MATTPDSVKRFYHSATWKRCRQLVIQLHRGRCKDCGKAGGQVHHKIPLTEQNLKDPYIALHPDNLELLCEACHNSKRADEKYVRGDLKFTADGDLIPRT